MRNKLGDPVWIWAAMGLFLGVASYLLFGKVDSMALFMVGASSGHYFERLALKRRTNHDPSPATAIEKAE